MAAFAFLLVLLVLLMVLIRQLYSGSPRPVLQEEEIRTDRLVSLIEPDLMESLLVRAREEGRSAVEIVNELIRTALRDPGASGPSPR